MTKVAVLGTGKMGGAIARRLKRGGFQLSVWDRTKSKAEALRQAQSDVRSTKGYESPRFWAAFQLVGAR